MPGSSARAAPAWYIACASGELGEAPWAGRILGTPLVVFRGKGGTPAALLDRCAHRNLPLSLGRVLEDRLECRYHGWQYGGDGRCWKIPGLCQDVDPERCSVPRYPVREQEGYVWVYSESGREPDQGPYALPSLGEGATEVRRLVEVECPLHAVLENALDVPHTSILHRGLFRGTREPTRIKVRVARSAQGVEAHYLGEPRPGGLAARILSPSGGVVTHVDRFILPSIAQVEYQLGSEARFTVTSLCTPVTEELTRIHAVISFRSRLPGWLVKILLEPVASRIFRQDAQILKAQGAALRRFGGEHYASTPIDVLGLQISVLLRRGEPGAPVAPPETDEWTREIEMEV